MMTSFVLMRIINLLLTLSIYQWTRRKLTESN